MKATVAERVHAHRGLCRAAARRFVRPHIEREDLEQVASLGLIKAAQRYDAERGTPFEPFAWSYVYGELMHYVRDAECIVRPSRSAWELQRRILRACERLLQKLEREPNEHELAAELQMTPTEIRSVLQVPFTFHNVVTEEVALPAAALDERLHLSHALQMLSADERAMIIGVYHVGLTQTEVGRRLGQRQRTASRLHARALRRLAEALGRNEA